MTTTDTRRTSEQPTRGPAPVVAFGRLIQQEDHPGVTFVLPYNAGRSAGRSPSTATGSRSSS